MLAVSVVVGDEMNVGEHVVDDEAIAINATVHKDQEEPVACEGIEETLVNARVPFSRRTDTMSVCW